ncbi:MAG: hypothetical protein JST54_19245 [Deltaproteobacteria bacterium]|nr:hypothetical protein [Deltaproteobacteria bacterium]
MALLLDTVDGIIGALYAAISGPAGARDWERFRDLFAPGARLVPTSKDGQKLAGTVLDVESFIARATLAIANQGFYEHELTRREERYGPIVHVWSSYACRHAPSDPEPFVRGVNSIQLLHDGIRFRLLTIFWADERIAGIPVT